MATIRTIPTLAVPQANVADPLSSLIQGLTQSVQINQMPQQLANQAIAQQLAAQLGQIKLLTAQKQLAELNRSPSDRIREALALKQAEKAMATDSLVEGPAGFGEIGVASSVGMTAPQIAALQQASQAPQVPEFTITDAPVLTSDLSLGGQPSASGLQLQVDQLPALDQAIGQAIQRQAPGFQVPSAPLRGVEREISGLPGLYRSSAAEQDFLKREIAKQRQLELNKIRELAPGASLMSGAEGVIFTAPEKGAAPRIQVEKVGNTIIRYQDGKEIGRETVPAGYEITKTDNGTFIGNPEDVNSFRLIPGTGPGKSRSTASKEELALADDFNRSPAVKEYFQAIGSVKSLSELAADPNATASDDVAMIFSFMRALDPRSTVREGEQATAQQTAGIPDIIRNYYNQAVAGNRLTQEQRNNFVKSATKSVKGLRSTYNIVRKRAVAQARRIGADEDIVVGDDIDLETEIKAGEPVMSFDSEQEAESKLPSGTHRVIINGVPGTLTK